ncbi:pantetheine-phosphate adenylyltransferase [Desulfoplanes formicivorans]|uniref:Phosphopantetheine adenylyltransferase n=1 Tax=Desulfoplanes formicivorans TaxID=1592317 RepID=A0A194AJP2_9BACT|nr:pantetheine-phosphate adenylyltransferase [Desulfoplanes formicivorans]GAU09538.1 phosphopantetheine adenylyltransferase [Desulfoplanes formicivorans]
MGASGRRIAIYPGTFDPLTNGHVSLIRRGFDIFDGVLVAVAADTGKKTLFSLDERVRMVREVFAREPRVTVEPFAGLLMDFVRRKKCKAILRGLRAVSDFEYEFQMGLMNRRLHQGAQTIYMMTDYKWLYISSTIIKNVAELGGDIRGLVPDSVEKQLIRRYQELREGKA